MDKFVTPLGSTLKKLHCTTNERKSEMAGWTFWDLPLVFMVGESFKAANFFTFWGCCQDIRFLSETHAGISCCKSTNASVQN